MLHDEILSGVWARLSQQVSTASSTGIATFNSAITTYKHFSAASGERAVLLLKGNVTDHAIQHAQIWTCVYVPNVAPSQLDITRLNKLKATVIARMEEMPIVMPSGSAYFELFGVDGYFPNPDNSNEGMMIMRYKIIAKEE